MYIDRLKRFGFPELGKITLSDEPLEQEKTYKFFEYIINKKANDSEDYKRYKNQYDVMLSRCQEYESEISKYEKEIKSLKLELQHKNNNKNDFELKCKKQKEILEKEIKSVKKENIFLGNKINKLSLDRKNLEEKAQNLIEQLNKFDVNKPKVINSIDATENLHQNDPSKMLSKISGTEKLLETLKSGYNESLRELIFEISALKNFIYDVHNEITMLLDKPETFEIELMNLPFLDTVNNIKEIFNKNMNLLKYKMGIEDNEEINFNNLNNNYIK